MPSGVLFEGLGALTQTRLQIPSIVDFSSTLVQTLNSAPADLIQAPGGGLVICPVAAAWQYLPGSVAFTNAVTLRLIWSDGSILATCASVPLNATTAKQGTFAIAGVVGVGNNAKVQLSAASDPAGSGNGLLRIIFCYMLMPMK